MTGEIVNLRLKRKQRDRSEREQAAEASRLHHGRTKAEREAARMSADQTRRHLDGHKRVEQSKLPDEADRG